MRFYVIPGLPLKCIAFIDFDHHKAYPKYNNCLSVSPVNDKSIWIKFIFLFINLQILYNPNYSELDNI